MISSSGTGIALVRSRRRFHSSMPKPANPCTSVALGFWQRFERGPCLRGLDSALASEDHEILVARFAGERLDRRRAGRVRHEPGQGHRHRRLRESPECESIAAETAPTGRAKAEAGSRRNRPRCCPGEGVRRNGHFCHAVRASITSAAPTTLTLPTHDLAAGAALAELTAPIAYLNRGRFPRVLADFSM